MAKFAPIVVTLLWLSVAVAEAASPAPTTYRHKAKCVNKWYPKCYKTEHLCPEACPVYCEVDCDSCKPVCKCDKPGAMSQEPRFTGGGGITFYFHGKKNQTFCLVSDTNLHINAHFTGRRNPDAGRRDFTWVQSIAVRYGRHQLFVGARDDSSVRLALSFDGRPVALPESEGATWRSSSLPAATVTRVGGTANGVAVEVEGSFEITAKVVPITEEESRVHDYGVSGDGHVFAHLDLGFKFLSLSNQVSGVLGQTYKPDYVSRVKVGATMPVMGGDMMDYATSSLFAPDCLVARFNGEQGYDDFQALVELPSFKCGSGVHGQGLVCKR